MVCCTRWFTACCLSLPLLPLTSATTLTLIRWKAGDHPCSFSFTLLSFCISSFSEYRRCVWIYSSSAPLSNRVDTGIAVPDCWLTCQPAGSEVQSGRVTPEQLDPVVHMHEICWAEQKSSQTRRYCLYKYLPVTVLSQEVKAGINSSEHNLVNW